MNIYFENKIELLGIDLKIYPIFFVILLFLGCNFNDNNSDITKNQIKEKLVRDYKFFIENTNQIFEIDNSKNQYQYLSVMIKGLEKDTIYCFKLNRYSKKFNIYIPKNSFTMKSILFNGKKYDEIEIPILKSDTSFFLENYSVILLNSKKEDFNLFLTFFQKSNNNSLDLFCIYLMNLLSTNYSNIEQYKTEISSYKANVLFSNEKLIIDGLSDYFFKKITKKNLISILKKNLDGKSLNSVNFNKILYNILSEEYDLQTKIDFSLKYPESEFSNFLINHTSYYKNIGLKLENYFKYRDTSDFINKLSYGYYLFIVKKEYLNALEIYKNVFNYLRSDNYYVDGKDPYRRLKNKQYLILQHIESVLFLRNNNKEAIDLLKNDLPNLPNENNTLKASIYELIALNYLKIRNLDSSMTYFAKYIKMSGDFLGRIEYYKKEFSSINKEINFENKLNHALKYVQISKEKIDVQLFIKRSDKIVSLEELKKEYYLIEFFSENCSGCISNLKHFISFESDKSIDISKVQLIVNDVSLNKLSETFLLENKNILQVLNNNDLPNTIHNITFPTTLILDKNMNIISKMEGDFPNYKFFRDWVLSNTKNKEEI